MDLCYFTTLFSSLKHMQIWIVRGFAEEVISHFPVVTLCWSLLILVKHFLWKKEHICLFHPIYRIAVELLADIDISVIIFGVGSREILPIEMGSLLKKFEYHWSKLSSCPPDCAVSP